MAENIDEFEDAVSEFIGETESLQQNQQELRRSKRLACKKSTFEETATEHSARIMATLTTEQFQKLVDQVNQPSARFGSFSSCTSRFNGERNPSKVEEFISAISTYKLVENITDENAVNSMPMLLEGDAAEWWRGVKASAEKFSDVTRMIRDAFSPPKPAWRIYAEINETKQQISEPTDSFIRKKRALFSRLEKVPDESDQIDILFGMLHSRIRERVLRHKIETFDDLLADAREAEYVLAERGDDDKASREGSSSGKMAVRCKFCKRKGHVEDDCFKKRDAVAQHPSANPEPIFVKPKYACYGCGKPGVVRAKCPNCSKDKTGSTPTKVAFNAFGVCAGSDIPMVNVEIFGIPGQAFFDCGSKTSIASANLKRIMEFKGCTFEKLRCHTTLADGSSKLQDFFTTVCKIVIGGKCLNIKFLAFPDDRENNRTLLGADFLESAEIVIRMGQRSWHFENNADQVFYFAEEWPLDLNLLEIIGVPRPVAQLKRTKAMQKMSSDNGFVTPKRQHKVQLSDVEISGPDYAMNSDYSPHSIQSIFKDALATTESTPERPSTLFKGVVRARTEDDPIFIPLNAFDFEILKPSDASNLNTEERKQLNDVLEEHRVLFGSSEMPTPYAVHKINTGDHEPIFSPPYRISFAKAEILKHEIESMLEHDVIEECESAWASPVVMVPKTDGTVRVCVDYRKLNSVTIPDRYPLPRMDDLLHAAKSTKFMSTLDLQSGYYQVEVALEDRDKTCLISPFGTFRFKRMPFGLRNAPATFQRLINRFKSGIPDICILAYLDDVIICSGSFEEHLKDLDKVLKRLTLFQLRLNNQKCHFCCASVKFLGHMLTPDGIAVDDGKIQAILKRTEPRNIKHLISFIQKCSWYRRFITNYAEIARPLTNLTKKTAQWKWTEKEEKAFKDLKAALTSSPVLKQAADGMPFIIKTDASAYAMGAVLLQGEGADEHPIEYASRLLSNAERNYSTTERETLAIVWACNKFRGYIDGAEVKLLTDHQPLKWLLTLKSPTGRLARWGLQLQQFNFSLEYLPGRANAVADMLSRPPCSADTHTASENCICAFFIDIPNKSSSQIREEQLKDDYIKDIISSIESQNENSLKWSNRNYLINNGILYCYADDDSEEAQLVIPSHERNDVLKAHHDESTAGHYGIERTTARICKRYYWPGMRAEIAKYIKNCIECQRFKATNLKPAGLLQTTSSKQRFEVVAVDLFGPLPPTEEGYKWILIVEDVASRWTEVFKLVDATAEACAKILIEEIFFRYGLPRRLKSDNGVQFVSAIMQQVTYCLGIQQQFTPVYHPEANPVERKNRDLKSQLAIIVQNHHNSWDICLPAIRFAMNSAKCQSTGFSAAYLTFGRELRTLDDVENDVRTIVESENFIPEISSYLKKMVAVLKDAKETEMKTQDKNKAYVDQHRRPQPQFEIGSKVLVNTHILSNAAKGVTSKFVPKRDGPYVIVRKVGSSTYEIASPKDLNIPLGTYHASALTLYKSANVTEVPEPVHQIRRRGRPKRKS